MRKRAEEQKARQSRRNVENVFQDVERKRPMPGSDGCERQDDFDGRVGVENERCRCARRCLRPSQQERQRRGGRSERVEREGTGAHGKVKAKGRALGCEALQHASNRPGDQNERANRRLPASGVAGQQVKGEAKAAAPTPTRAKGTGETRKGGRSGGTSDEERRR